jgi:Kef-type K+ transport system membrane component KefB
MTLAREPFGELALLLLVAAAAGAIAVRLKQPVLIAYIVAGIAVGPAGFGVVSAHDQIDLLAQIGVAVLLFLVGLRLDLQHVRHIGPVALATGLGQLAFTIVIGFGIILLLGKDWLTALYVAVALTFSSTIIVIKLLSDKREIDSLHGRIAVGFLIVQDIAVVIAMMVMSALRDTGQGDDALLMVGLSILARIGAAAILMFVLMRYVLPPVMQVMARSQELLLIFAIAWGTALAALGEWVGFSKEAGAFLAGFSLASTHFRDAIGARLTGLRDFLLLFFFIDLGAKLDFSTLGGELVDAIVLSLFVLIGNPLIVMSIMGYMGYRKRTGLLAGLTVAQISEFSIIFVAMGISLGHVGNDALGLTTLVGVVTIAVSTYAILGSQALYERLAPWLGVFERRRPHRELAAEQPRAKHDSPRIVVVGLGRFGSRLLEDFRDKGIPAVGVDFDPETVRSLRHKGFPVVFGDAEDPSLMESVPLATADWVVSTMPAVENNALLVHGLGEAGFKGRVAVVIRDPADARRLPRGIAQIIDPFSDAADHAAQRLIEDVLATGSAP